jgi:hypothetical protein
MQVPVVTAVAPLGGHRLRLRFEDGVEGDIDLAALVAFRGVFAPLLAPEYVSRAFVSADTGTVAWPNGADLDPLVLYARVTGRTVQELLAIPDAVAR